VRFAGVVTRCCLVLVATSAVAACTTTSQTAPASGPGTGTGTGTPTAIRQSMTDQSSAATGRAVAQRPPKSSAVIAVPGTALAALAALPVKGRAPKTGYQRAQFGESWTDDVSVDGGHNGCDTRNDILRRDLTAAAVKPGSHGCTVATGTLHDPYTGKTIDFVRGAKTSVLVQIDHVVALSDAWQTGAQALSASARQNMAGDPLELLAVDGPTNASKGDGDAATWLPPVKSYRCDYVSRQIAVKTKYSLWVTAAESAAMATVLAACPGQRLPTSTATDVPVIPAR
jgi:hypothetical protein